MNALATVVSIEASGHWSEAKYRAEREAIRATYGDSNVEAGAKRDQALAGLFYRSGWTQEQLAKVEGKSREWIAKRTLFGRFLAFGTDVPKPKNLTEGRFRDYWGRTDTKQNEGQRFTAVLRELAESTPAAPPRRGLGVTIRDNFGDGKWHKIETIAAHVGEPPESLTCLLNSMTAKNNNWNVAICEKRRVGAKDGTWSYRIVKGGQKIDLTALTQELLPILEELEMQGKQHRASCSPPAVLSCVHHIRKLLETLAQPAAPSR